MTANTQIAILRRMLDPDNGGLSPEAARFFLHLDFPQKDHDRMAELAAKAGTGKLSLDESFHEPGATALGVSFDRQEWPHGKAGRAIVHGALFGPQ